MKQMIVAGVLVTAFVAASWVGATHLIKDLFLRRAPPIVYQARSYQSPLPVSPLPDIDVLASAHHSKELEYFPDFRIDQSPNSGNDHSAKSKVYQNRYPRKDNFVNYRIKRNSEFSSKLSLVSRIGQKSDFGIESALNYKKSSNSHQRTFLPPNSTARFTPNSKRILKPFSKMSQSPNSRMSQTPDSPLVHTPLPRPRRSSEVNAVFDAPLFTTWFCTAWTTLFFPLYLMCRSCACRGRADLATSLRGVTAAFRERGVTCSKLLSRCSLFAVLWVATHYMYVYSLRILDCTDVMALYSAHVAFVYLLAWVILHEQFVGVRVSCLVTREWQVKWSGVRVIWGRG
ncbi:hypothetical protein HAZT_HAZT007648 [Hyalella azteca]|uniref:Uncharacterized protein n=1 Tax=Hyalella azteca TaxID=294128 RepID=A0A6A0GS61_HYAAZ|nr:hypothetical protein HAZT_HAZT007648 [Hyalella azteca]